MPEIVKAKGFRDRLSQRYVAKAAKAVIAAKEAWANVEPGQYDQDANAITFSEPHSATSTYVSEFGWIGTTEFLGRQTIKLQVSEPDQERVSFAYASNPRRESNLGVSIFGNAMDGYRLVRYESGRDLKQPNFLAPWTLRTVRRAAEEFTRRATKFPQRRKV